MPGPAAKPAEQRARRNAPALGEWRSLPPILTPVLPELPPLYIGDAEPVKFVCVCGKVAATEHGLKIHIGRSKNGRHTRFEPIIDPELRWSRETLEIWEGFRWDYATQEYGPSEIAMAKQLARLIELAARAQKSATLWSEVRQWMDRLMLTPKGKRDARILLAQPAKVTSLRSLTAPNFKRAAGG